MSTRVPVTILALLGLVACRDPDDDILCAVTVTLSGDITASMPERVSCIGSSTESGIEVMFQTEDGHPIGTFYLVIADVTRGETGEFPATVQVFNPAGAIWATDDCVVTIESHDFRHEVCEESSEFGEPDHCYGVDEYRVTGHGACRTPAREAGGGSITVGPFTFVTYHWWPQ